MAAERIADSHCGGTGPIVLILETPPAATVAAAPMLRSRKARTVALVAVAQKLTVNRPGKVGDSIR